MIYGYARVSTDGQSVTGMSFALAQPLAVMQCRAGSCPPPTGVSSLLCTPGDISTLRRGTVL